MYETDYPCFFASANTANGFISKFNEVFDPEKLNQIYIIKGGPGTGKSSLMKGIEKIAKEKGLKVEDFLCSSDPNSLDAIYIRDKKIAVLDGTSPHTFDPSYPGAVENIINTGSFWNIDELSKYKKEIINLIQEKARYYKRAYRFLKAYGETEKEIFHYYQKSFYNEKVEQNICRILKKIPTFKGSGKTEIRLDETVGATGVIKLNTFETLSEKVFTLFQNEYIALEYLNKLYHKLKIQNYDMILSFSHKFPDKISSIFLPNEKITFQIREKKENTSLYNKEYVYLNMKRFYDADMIFSDLQKIHFGKRCSRMLLNGAAESLSEAKKIHAELEKIYVSAMDFKKFNDEREKLISRIFP